jgi:hypothetical protein
VGGGGSMHHPSPEVVIFLDGVVFVLLYRLGNKSSLSLSDNPCFIFLDGKGIQIP